MPRSYISLRYPLMSSPCAPDVSLSIEAGFCSRTPPAGHVAYPVVQCCQSLRCSAQGTRHQSKPCATPQSVWLPVAAGASIECTSADLQTTMGRRFENAVIRFGIFVAACCGRLLAIVRRSCAARSYDSRPFRMDARALASLGSRQAQDTVRLQGAYCNQCPKEYMRNAIAGPNSYIAVVAPNVTSTILVVRVGERYYDVP